MAISIKNNLYPPIFNQSYMPAFIYNDDQNGCRVYFTISHFNSIDQLLNNAVQITVQSQRNNQSVLKSTKYPSGIKLSELKIDTTRSGEDIYYVDIFPNDIEGGFLLNEYYKVQIRFTATSASAPPSQGIGIDSWLSENIEFFSQWSTVVLIYGISNPIILLNGFSNSSTQRTILSDKNVTLDGIISFENDSDKETIKSYQIFLYNQNQNTLLETSDIIYLNNSDNNKNQINYIIKEDLQNNINYKLKIQIITYNLYTLNQPKEFLFKISTKTEQHFDVDLTGSSDNNSGSIKLILKNKYLNSTDQQIKFYIKDNNILVGKTLNTNVYLQINPQTANAKIKSAYYYNNNDNLTLYNSKNPNQDFSKGTTLTFRRASNKTNFKKWQNIDTVTIQSEHITELIWNDYTVEPGVWYKYIIIRTNEAFPNQSCFIETENKYMVVTDDIFLTAAGKQLKIKFDPQINSFSIKTAESLTETIGSQYPYIRRNGNIYYKTFTLSGTITCFMDIDQNLMLASKKDVYGDAFDLYQQYNIDENITLFNDFIYQKEFRNKVIDFLYKDEVKLFRSLTQGNILIKLMNITFTPNTTLGRRIYSFSCTAYEIDDSTVQNYQKYNIPNLPARERSN